eukprot:gene14621-16208_t
MKIQQIPLDLQLFIASFLNYGDQISFGSCCSRFQKDLVEEHFRYFTVNRRSKFYQLFNTNDKAIQERFKKAIRYSRRQLKLFDPSRDDLIDFPLTEVYHLETNCDNFHDYFSYKFHFIQSLTIYNTTPPKNPLLLNKEDNNFYQLKVLKLYLPTAIPFELPPLPPAIHTLVLSGKFSNLNNETFQQFSNLQIVELGQIDGLVDVSMLGDVPSLRIVDCNNLINITPLQNNRKIIIEGCAGIKDYRNAFTNSQKIWITLPHYYSLPQDSFVSIDFKQLKRVKTLSLTSGKDFPFQPSSKIFPVTLRRLRLSRMMIDEYGLYKFDQLFKLELAHSPTFWNTEYLKQFMDFNVVYVRKNEAELKLQEVETDFLEDDEV